MASFKPKSPGGLKAVGLLVCPLMGIERDSVLASEKHGPGNQALNCLWIQMLSQLTSEACSHLALTGPRNQCQQQSQNNKVLPCHSEDRRPPRCPYHSAPSDVAKGSGQEALGLSAVQGRGTVGSQPCFAPGWLCHHKQGSRLLGCVSS